MNARGIIWLTVFVGLLILCLLLISGCAPLLDEAQVSRDQLRYNYHEHEWKYASPQASLRYNYLEKRYEFAE